MVEANHINFLLFRPFNYQILFGLFYLHKKAIFQMADVASNFLCCFEDHVAFYPRLFHHNRGMSLFPTGATALYKCLHCGGLKLYFETSVLEGLLIAH